MTVRVTGILRDSGGNPTSNGVIKFYTKSGFGGTLPSATLEVVTGSDGSYDFDLAIGVHLLSVQYGQTLSKIDKVTVASETPSPQTLDSLLMLTEPLLPDEIILVQQLVAQANEAALSASVSAGTAQAIADSVDGSLSAAVASATEASETSAAEAATSAKAFYNSNPANIDWDLFIPFNSDGELERGVGTRNSYGNKAVDFIRSTVATVVNKSGVLEDLAIDEIAVGKDGAWFHEAYTNYFLNNGDSSQWNSSDCTLADTGDNGVDGNPMTVATATDDFPRIISNAGLSSALTAGEKITVSMYVKAGTTDQVRFRFAGANGFMGQIYMSTSGVFSGEDTYTRGFVEYVGGGIYKLSGIRELVSDDSAPYAEIQVSYNGLVTGTNLVGKTIQVQYPQVTLGIEQILPTIKTGSSTTSVGATDCTVPINSNLVGTEKSFTICVDVATENTGTYLCVFRTDPAATSGFNLTRNTGGYVQFGLSNGSSNTFAASSSVIDNEMHRYHCVYDADLNQLLLYIDGSLSGEISFTGSPVYDLAEVIHIGNKEGIIEFINSTLKNFGIIGRALTADEIKARGPAL